jgi:hypothetical protein
MVAMQARRSHTNSPQDSRSLTNTACVCSDGSAAPPRAPTPVHPIHMVLPHVPINGRRCGDSLTSKSGYPAHARRNTSSNSAAPSTDLRASLARSAASCHHAGGACFCFFEGATVMVFFLLGCAPKQGLPLQWDQLGTVPDASRTNSWHLQGMPSGQLP